MMRISKRCPWCEALNQVSDDRGNLSREVFCTECGHRADLAPVFCTCATCQSFGVLFSVMEHQQSHLGTSCCGD
jgi:hypothetical protein